MRTSPGSAMPALCRFFTRRSMRRRSYLSSAAAGFVARLDRNPAVVLASEATMTFELPIPENSRRDRDQNRDLYAINQANEGEIAALSCAIDAAPGSERDVLDDWRLVVIRARQSAEPAWIVLLGDAEQQRFILCTSEVLALDLGRGVARTRNSIYRLHNSGIGEPRILHLCAALHTWGVGNRLGALNIYY